MNREKKDEGPQSTQHAAFDEARLRARLHVLRSIDENKKQYLAGAQFDLGVVVILARMTERVTSEGDRAFDWTAGTTSVSTAAVELRTNMPLDAEVVLADIVARLAENKIPVVIMSTFVDAPLKVDVASLRAIPVGQEAGRSDDGQFGRGGLGPGAKVRP